jgi:hypothetical protein
MREPPIDDWPNWSMPPLSISICAAAGNSLVDPIHIFCRPDFTFAAKFAEKVGASMLK